MNTFSENKKQGVGNTQDTHVNLHLVLSTDTNEMYERWFPDIIEGFFPFTDRPELSFLNIVAQEGQWYAVCKDPAFFRNVPVTETKKTCLERNQTLIIESDNKTYRLYVSKVQHKDMVYHNYAVDKGADISIGSQYGNDICCESPYVSRNHAVLRYSVDGWSVWDCNSLNGTYINGVRRASAVLSIGDVVYIMGLRIIIGTNFVSVNDDTGKITVSRKLKPMIRERSKFEPYGQVDAVNEPAIFNRSPRKRIEVHQKTITIEEPPMSMERKQLPLMLRMGGSMVMGGASALAGNYTTVLSSVLFPLLTSKYTDKERKEYEELRVKKYTEYLEKKYQEILQACWEEQNILNMKYPPFKEILSYNKQVHHLWERRLVDNDFLHVRLGTGTQPMSAKIDYPIRRFEIEEDELEGKMYELVEQRYHLEDVPVILPLADTLVCGLVGPKETVGEYLLQLILQIAVLHSYDELKIVFYASPEELVYMKSIRYLPHIWSDQKDFRLIATNEAEAYALGEYLERQLGEDEEKDCKQILKSRPYYLIISMNKRISETHKIFKEIVQSETKRGVSIIAAYDDLPKETEKIITLRPDGKNTCTTLSADGGEEVVFEIESYTKTDATEMLRTLANTRLRTVTQAQEIPKMITFLEMFQAGRIEQLNPLKRWMESNPVKSLAAPVGIGVDGSIFELDLHEKRQGPHGLVAGMTGSGKSEFIITYILSMAVNYHPDEVAFVLIDYKGGGLTGAFENPQMGIRLPHLAGTITNLDGASIQRSLMSLESELVRRQKIFNDIKGRVNEGTMDIYTYQKIYRDGKVADPMPHLFIISDEFAELKQQQPEFMDKLISIARIGRSLGVHLILATQKPSGVVNDQIRSNTKFRVCLKVQDHSDSMDMLKRPEAASLTDVGRFYLQVGYNEYFAMGQSAWCGADYQPQDTVVVQRDDAVEFIDITGQVVHKAKPEIQKTDSGMKQIVAIVKYLADIAESRGIQTRPLWKPELPIMLDMETFGQKYNQQIENPFAVCTGLVDDPEMMRQFPMVLDFMDCQNTLLVGDAGSGKTAMVQNILWALSHQLPPQDFQFYVLDYSSRMLKSFKILPHCGAVLQEEDSDKLGEFFDLINGIIAQRKKLFSELGVDKFETAREIQRIPLVLVVIDNAAGMSSSKGGESHMYKLESYLKNCSNYGVKYFITSSHLNEVSSRVRQELPERICLHMKDKYDYGEMLGGKVHYVPPELPGRGLYNVQGRILEFQGALLEAGADEAERIAAIQKAMADVAERSDKTSGAQRMAVVSEDAEYEEFAAQFSRGRIPLGYFRTSGKPIALPLKQFSKMSIFFGNPSGKQQIWKNIVHAAYREDMELIVIQRSNNSCFEGAAAQDVPVKKPAETTVLPLNNENVNLLRQALTAELTKRAEYIETYCAEHQIMLKDEKMPSVLMDALLKDTKPVLVLIESFGDFCMELNAMPAATLLSYVNILRKIQQRNVYVVAGFEPQLPKEATSNLLFGEFNSDSDQLLMGGRLSMLNTCEASITSAAGGEMWPYNTGIMRYRGSFYPILMPCGPLEDTVMDEDLEHIFGNSL